MKLLDYEVGNDRPLFLIAGPCVVESRDLTLQVAATLKEITQRLGVAFVFKASFDKANRSSSRSFRGPGIEAGLRVLELVKKGMSAQEMIDAGAMKGLSRTFSDPFKFAYDAHKGYWAHHNGLGGDVL